MELIQLTEKDDYRENKKLYLKYLTFDKLIQELEKREIPEDVMHKINLEIEALNEFYGTGKEFLKHIRKAQSRIIKIAEKELKLVTKGYYRGMWTALGMTTFGIPFGVAFGTSLGNMGFLGIGLPIGLAIGIAIGSAKDKKVEEEGRQLDLEIEADF